uniref:Uncharacterized protein n=1 Tax=Globisporangium ultimum (strain ATCC 200006 / CBS 805.95 / DAOM BR144) TaxID=431595 RepID=K3WM06_GLOUD
MEEQNGGIADAPQHALASGQPCASSEAVSAWPQRARALLESQEIREKLEAYTLLSTKCCESKDAQNDVGVLLREKQRGNQTHRLLHIVFEDIEVTDKTLRLAATRLICQVAYENLLNQDSIMQLANGFSVGWIHIFSIPQSFRERYEADCTVSKWPQSARGFKEFLKTVVTQNYASIYNHVSSYYSDGCRCFLPLSWHSPDTGADTREGKEDVPDPASHLVGFYLVPRQAQFPEQDDFYNDELLGAMDADDADRIHRLHAAFQTLAESNEGSVSKSMLYAMLASGAHGDFRWVLQGDSDNGKESSSKPSVESIFQYFLCEATQGGPNKRDAAAGPSGITWNEVLVYCCMKSNVAKLQESFGVDAYATLLGMFQQLSLRATTSATTAAGGACRVCSSMYVWEPVFVGAIRSNPTLPAMLKRHVACFQRGLYRNVSNNSHPPFLKTPWWYLLRFRLDQIQPLSWCVFLTQWRVAAETYNASLVAPPRRMTTACSVSSIRKSIVGMEPRSFKSITEFSQQLPGVCRFQRDIREPIHESVATADDEAQCEDFGDHKLLEALDVESQMAGASDGSLAHYLQLFRQMQNSVVDLDKLSLQQLREKQAATSKLHEAVANNKKRLADEAKRKRRELEERCREQEEKLEELQRKKAETRSQVQQKQFSRHDMASRRRQQQQTEDEAKQQALMAQMELAQAESRRFVEAKLSQHQSIKNKRPSQEEPNSLPSRPKSSAPQRPDSKRPLSARTSSSAALPPPEILRQRAQMYGDVVSKIYVAEASRHPQPPTLSSALPQSPYLARRYSNFRKQSAMTSNNDPDPLLPTPSLMTNSSIKYHSKPEWKLHSDSSKQGGSTSVMTGEGDRELVDGFSTACTTLVMRNAALAVSKRISIPTIPAPIVNEPNIPAYVIEAQYLALGSYHKQKFRERFNLKRVSHRLSYTVLKQFTKIVRRDMAWEEFHDAAARSNGGRPCGRIRHLDFLSVAQHLGITLPAKKLLLIARTLDDKKNGFVEWEHFYSWWAAQYEDHAATART